MNCSAVVKGLPAALLCNQDRDHISSLINHSFIYSSLNLELLCFCNCSRDKYEMFQSRSGMWMKAGIGLAVVTTLGLILLRYLSLRT